MKEKFDINTHITLDKYFDEDFELITPANRIRCQLGLFDHLLEEDEVIEYYNRNDNLEFYSKNEAKFFRFFELIFEKSSPNEMFLELNTNEISNRQICEILLALDFEDRDIWIEFVKQLSTYKSHTFCFDSFSELKMWFKIISRELSNHDVLIHFERGTVSLLSNYDLFFPMFFSNEKLIKKYQDYAKKSDLNLLKISM